MDNCKLLGFCGLYCGACPHHRALFKDGRYILEGALKNGLMLEEFTCEGCGADKSLMRKACADCDMRACAMDKKVEHCGECDNFPCGRFTAFQNDGLAHHLDIVANVSEIKNKGAKQWLSDQSEDWKCECGRPFSWYESVCSNCSSKLDSYKRL